MAVLRPARRAARTRWADAPLVVKALLAVAVPIAALVVSSVLILQADRARSTSHHRADASELVDIRVSAVRSASAISRAAWTAYFADPDESSLAMIEAHRAAWGSAIDDVEDAVDATDDRRTQVLAGELRRAANELNEISDYSLRVLHGEGDYEPETFVRSEEANARFVDALEAISDEAHGAAAREGARFERVSQRTKTLMLGATLVGVIGAVLGTVIFALAIVRRVRRLQDNARALGKGEELEPIEHSGDELGQLGRGLDRAASLLRERSEEVRQSEQTLSFALESGAMGTWDVDLLTGHSRWDRQCELDHGLEPGSFGGSFESWLELVHPDDRAAVLASGGEAMANGGRWSTSYRTAVDGSTRWIGTSGRAVTDDTGAVVRLVGVANDITERKQSEDALREAIAEAERANRAKSEFLSRVSHELRTPLNAILGFGQLLEMDDLGPAQRESVDQVLRGGRHLLGLIDDVLDISRIESGTLALSLEPVCLGELLAESLALVAPLAADRRVELTSLDPATVGLFVNADRRRLKQILLNLLSNAIKYNRTGGTVTVTCNMLPDDVVRVSVADTGAGIAADRLERLFTPFDRLGAEQTPVDGTGIGLALSQRLAELLASTLVVDTVEGHGSTFWLDLALVDDPAKAADEAAPAVPQRIATGERTVLYVEDNPSNLRLVQRVIERRGGIHIVPAATGTVALATIQRMPVDLVLLDVHLPDMDGADVLDRLRSNPATASTPVVVVTADASSSQAHRMREAGADAFLSKPLDLALLVETIDELLLAVKS